MNDLEAADAAMNSYDLNVADNSYTYAPAPPSHPRDVQPEDSQVTFMFHHPGGEAPEAVLEFKANGDIYVRGRLVENDREVVEGLRMLLAMAGVNPPPPITDSIKLVVNELGRLYPGEPEPKLKEALKVLDTFVYGSK
jgi:hypothetical protein